MKPLHTFCRFIITTYQFNVDYQLRYDYQLRPDSSQRRSGLVVSFDLRAIGLPQRSPTTVASVVALLADGNLHERLAEDAEWWGMVGARPALWGRRTRLWLGWGLMPDEEGVEMGNENENGVSRFGIYVVPPDEEMPKRLQR